ncbi:RNA-binding protein [Rugosibacter aromaticivorans]|uniref:RNA-binding protein n=1 Tax=Rugosibacter aromaticivorans TaxID=1565605 RepID=A0A0C5J8D7_9PROT|nr:RNA-binding S4 domain-containing protein [Rugosibacter aromaticivorans]AJP48205.1 RNA-binding protein [Rugosibacter aromaticivorans]ART38374.1 G244 [uncultured bacterium]ART39885.1 J103 [uncultured bacterium]
MTDAPDPPQQRIDKWLWAARFCKTRRLAADAVDGGKVKLNGQPVKPSRELKCGDKLEIALGELRWVVCVRGINRQRRPATEARLLYEESPESIARRAQQQEIGKLAPMPGAALKGRPTKKAGRLIRGFNE